MVRSKGEWSRRPTVRGLPRWLAVLGAGALVLAACNGGDADDVEPDDADEVVDADDAADEGDDTDGADAADADIDEEAVVSVDLTNEPDSIDPLYRNEVDAIRLSQLLYSRLHAWDEESRELVPDLAELPEISDDGMTYTMELRDGVTFHDGTPLTVEDVVYSYETVMDPEAGTIWTGSVADVEEVEALDDTTIEIRLSSPNQYLRTSSIPIIPADTEYVANDTYAQDANGTGPFQLESYQPGELIELRRYDDYHGEVPRYGGIEFRFISENASRLARLANNETDIVTNLPAEQLELAEDQGANAAIVEDNVSRLFLWPSTNEDRPTSDVNFRLALSWAVDRGAIIDQVYGGAARPNATYLAFGSQYHDEEYGLHFGEEPDLELAQEYLEEAGGAPDRPLEMIVANVPHLIDSATVVQASLEALGLETRMEVMELAGLVPRLLDGSHDFAIYSMPTTTTVGFAPDYPYAGLLCGTPSNLNQFCDPEMDEVLQTAIEAPPEEAEEAWRGFQAYDVETQGQIQLVVSQYTEAWSDRLVDYEPSSLAWLGQLPSAAVQAE